MFVVLDFVRLSARSGSYSPGPIFVLGLSGRFSPILKDLTLELNLYPSSYWPGATFTSPPYAKEEGLAGDPPMLMFGLLDFVRLSARSGS